MGSEMCIRDSYMTAVHIDTIHGDHFIREMPAKNVDVSRLIDPLAAAAANGAQGVRLTWVRNHPTYVLKSDGGEKVVDAANGGSVAPLTEAEIRSIATATYTGAEAIASARNRASACSNGQTRRATMAACGRGFRQESR